MRTITDYQSAIVHLLATHGPMHRRQIANLGNLIDKSINTAMRTLIPGGFVQVIGKTRVHKKDAPIYKWTGKKYGEVPAEFLREAAMRVAAQHIGAMVRSAQA